MKTVYHGKCISEGTAMAAIHLFSKEIPQVPVVPAEDVEKDILCFEEVHQKAVEELQNLYQSSLKKMSEEDAEIFDAHLTLLNDEYSISEPIKDLIRDQKMNVAAAIDHQFCKLAQMFRSLGDELMAERAADVDDLRDILLRIVFGLPQPDISHLDKDVILLAHDLTPSDTVRMDTAHIKGIATKLGGVTSHTAIIARTLGIPAVSGLCGWEGLPLEGKPAILDGKLGTLNIEPSRDEITAFYDSVTAAHTKQMELKAYCSQKSRTSDGQALKLCANIGSPKEAKTAEEFGADGVGLFRSEFLFMNREDLPTEEEQYTAYTQALKVMGEKPVIVRTLDVGGDKKLPALDLPPEKNPFLGYRAIRITLDRTDVFVPQLRALLRAAVHGNLWIMFPMISCLEELRQAKAMLYEEERKLRAAGVEVGSVQIGMMIEIPSAAILANRFAKEVDFFSIGTNDLIQYTLAAERGNESVEHLYDPLHPAVLRLISNTAQAAKEAGILCGVCGEAAADERLSAALIGMGITELSMSPRKIPGIRKLLSTQSMEECRQIAQELLKS
jgi:phosphotransferase system enzyme I (PtsI)